MELIIGIKTFVLGLCLFNYIANLYIRSWDFGHVSNMGWLLAVLGWFSAVMS